MENQEVNEVSTAIECPTCHCKQDIKILTIANPEKQHFFFPIFLIIVSLALIGIGIVNFYEAERNLNSASDIINILQAMQKYNIAIEKSRLWFSLGGGLFLLGVIIIIVQPYKPLPYILFVCPACGKYWTVHIPDIRFQSFDD